LLSHKAVLPLVCPVLITNLNFKRKLVKHVKLRHLASKHISIGAIPVRQKRPFLGLGFDFHMDAICFVVWLSSFPDQVVH